MKPTILVMTTVHWPDDTRIRERLIRTLSSEFRVLYAARSPGPTDAEGLQYLELKSGRLSRNWSAIRMALSNHWDVLVVHDPELLVCAVLARMRRRRPVVFDVHEDIPASVYTRSWVPRTARRPLSLLMRAVLRLVEPALTISLAEPGYQRLFARPHPTFPNHPDTTNYPEASVDSHRSVIYLGDVTFGRGVDVAVAACSSLGVPLRLVGRVTPETEALLGMGSTLGDDLTFYGLTPNQEALDLVAGSSVGLAPLRDLPNYRHSQPTKILEYLAVGIPVVATDLPGTRELVAGLDAVFLVESGDVDALADGIAKARTPDMARVARAQAPSIRARFRWPAEQVLDFYRVLT